MLLHMQLTMLRQVHPKLYIPYIRKYHNDETYSHCCKYSVFLLVTRQENKFTQVVDFFLSFPQTEIKDDINEVRISTGESKNPE